ncbi:hypothetical protein Q7P37_004432 [Cladosporium fusiforme]
MLKQLFFLWPFTASASPHGPITQRCKPTYGSPGWPAADEWQRLNGSVFGRLVIPSPPGAVCHPTLPQYDNASCELVQSQWPNTSFHAINLISTDYNDVACLPNSTYPCTVDSYPRYVIPAANAQDVQNAISFARETGVRLIVKGTGHDVPGRSSGSDSLSIQTHNIRGLSLTRGEPRALALGGVASLKILAGERMADVYKFAAANNITVVGGADPHVGIGGWIANGGHGPVSAHYGMGADQVLEMEVVTADGKFRTVNENSDPDLFWALRGGGASNFAVIISVTVKAYEMLPYTEFYYAYNTTANSDAFWSMAAYFHSEIPRLAKSGLMGYLSLVPFDATEQNKSMQAKLGGVWLAPNLKLQQVQALLSPMEERMRKAQWGDPIVIDGHGEERPDFAKGFSIENTPEPAGLPIRLGSRLLDESALSKPLPELKNALKKATGEWLTLGHVIAGPGTWSPKGGVAGGSNAVSPAWRKACMQIALPRSWDPLNVTQKEVITTKLRTQDTQELRDLAPDTGAYVNEADPTEPDWQKTFYGANYERLFALKRRWDPHGVFWYKNGIGSELWNAVGDFGIENGVGQNPVQLCRA